MLYLTAIVSALICMFLCVFCIHDWKKLVEETTQEQEIHSNKKEIILYFVIILTSVCWVFLFDKYGYGPIKCMKYCCLLWGLVPIAYRDWKTQIIPNRWLLYLIAIRVMLLIVECFSYPDAILDNIIFIFIGFFVSGAVMFMAYVISRHEIGMGDVKLFMVTGMYLGLSLNYIVLLASLIFSAIYGGIKLVKKDLKSKDAIPFAPFVLLGAVLCLGLGF